VQLPDRVVLLNYVFVYLSYFGENFNQLFSIFYLAFAESLYAVVVLNELSFLKKRNSAVGHLECDKLVMYALVH
jgi:hypothetical protein